MKLIDKTTGKEIKVGDEVTTFRGEKAILKSLQPPHKPSSTGKVYIDEGFEFNSGYYPSVINAEFKEA